jgi:hypothetical protein
MHLRKDGREKGMVPPPEPSPATLDPYLAIAASVITQAIKDLNSPDLLRALDALVWLSSDEATLWLETLGIVAQPHQIFLALAKGWPNGKPKQSFAHRLAGRALAEHVHS